MSLAIPKAKPRSSALAHSSRTLTSRWLHCLPSPYNQLTLHFEPGRVWRNFLETISSMTKRPTLKPRQVYLVANGDLRLSANQKCWSEQAKMEAALSRALKVEGWSIIRAHPYEKAKQHGFIDSQKMGIEVFRKLDPHAPLIVAECVWQ